METKKLSLGKKCMALLIGIALLLSAAITPMAASPVGDLNGDNTVSAPDLSTLKIVLLQGVRDIEYDLNGDGAINILDYIRLKKKLAYAIITVSATVEPVDGKVPTGGITLIGGGVSAFIPEGVLLEDGVDTLTLTITPLLSLSGDLSVGENEEITPYDVHISGISKENIVPIIIDMGVVMPKYLNMGNYHIYHVEDGENKLMTLVDSKEELTAHNQFTYDPNTGAVTVAMATFSEVAFVADIVNAWNGAVDTSWYNTTDKSFTIYNADQLAGFGQIVGGMAEDIKLDAFEGKTVKLLADIDLGDAEDNNDEDKIFYPIGYYNNAKTYVRPNAPITSSVSSFEGTFDGNGHTIKNFYQNTWEMVGDDSHYPATDNYYNDAMGLFGYVLNGTVKNLTVDNFSSDGEFTPTGVIAAYASNATFENIAITNCNPRVYNTGNGGIVGIGGNDNDPDTYNLTFNNITIDNSNKISALWGSWDVACGGLVGMFRGAGHAYMKNCHVAAQIDVFNDVCGNYQYYWYRYAGMMIGTNKNMTTDANGYTVPETDKFHAEDCTVHFGEWNDYYYCELVANSLASYTHDHQFSRLTQIASLDEIYDGENWTKTGNFLLISGDTKTCYHIVKKDDVLTQHFHADAGEETVNEETVLKEDKQIVYLPFNQLFTGYGWGVKHIPVYNGENYAFDGITILDRTVADSVVKFDKADNVEDVYASGTTVSIGGLFKAAGIEDTKLTIRDNLVKVFVSPADNTSSAGGTYKADLNDWTQGTLTFSGTGKAIISITDYYFCKTTTIEVTVTSELKNGSFDNGVDGYSKYNTTLEVIEDPDEPGNKVLHAVCLETEDKTKGYYQTVDVEYNTDYTWVFRMKTIGTEDNEVTRVAVYPENGWSSMITSITDVSNKAFSKLYENDGTAEVRTIDQTWQTFVVKFNSGKNGQVRLYHNMWATGREVYMDDWTLYKDPTVGEFENAGFETGLEGWLTTAQLTTEVVTDEVHDGQQALKLSVGVEELNTAFLYKEVAVKPNTDYVWSYWFKCDSESTNKPVLSGVRTIDGASLLASTLSSDGGYIVPECESFAELRDSDNNLYWHQGMTTPSWQKYEVSFNSGEYTSLYLTINMFSNARLGWIDDWSLTESVQ